MDSSEILRRYITFFESNGHKRIANAPLVLQNDPTTLFTSSGMQPLVPYLLGEVHPEGKRLVNVQNCIRSQDIDEIGDNRHTTFFRMIGNWSLGDYFKKEEIHWLWKFLTEELNLPKEKLYITVFKGIGDIPKDEEAVAIWNDILTKSGLNPKSRIFYYSDKSNWWSRAGIPDKMPTGEPGGPSTEVFYEFPQVEHDKKFGEECHPNCDCGRFMEIGNSVFMQYIKHEDGSFKPLPNKNIDFGGGLERLGAATENQPDVFKTHLFSPIIRAIEKVTKQSYSHNAKEMRIIADHIISAVFIVNAGVEPSKEEQGYVLRRFIRRAFDQIYKLRGFEHLNLPTFEIIDSIITQYSQTNPVLEKNRERIKQTILNEINNYRGTLKKSTKILTNTQKINVNTNSASVSAKANIIKEISVEDAFKIYTTHGLSPEQIKNQGYKFDEVGFKKKMEEHKNLSRAGATKKFRGGLADHSERTIMGHTATHLLHQALRDVLGDHVHQTGSNITTERVRFDFNHGERLSDEQLKEVENIVQKKIEENLPVHYELIPTEEAHQMGAIGLFMDTYGEKSKIYFIGDTTTSYNDAYSIEFCGGPHVEFTGALKSFKIIKQENLGKNQKRLYAVVDPQ